MCVSKWVIQVCEYFMCDGNRVLLVERSRNFSTWGVLMLDVFFVLE